MVVIYCKISPTSQPPTHRCVAVRQHLSSASANHPLISSAGRLPQHTGVYVVVGGGTFFLSLVGNAKKLRDESHFLEWIVTPNRSEYFAAFGIKKVENITILWYDYHSILESLRRGLLFGGFETKDALMTLFSILGWRSDPYLKSSREELSIDLADHWFILKMLITGLS